MNSCFLRRGKPSDQEQSRTVDPGCGKILFNSATRMSCGGCEIASWTYKVRQQQGMPTRVGEVVPSCGLRSEGVVTDIDAFKGRKRGQGSLRDTVDNGTVQHSVEVRFRFGWRSPSGGGVEHPCPWDLDMTSHDGASVTSSPDPKDRDAFLDGFEQDLCPVGSDGVGTQAILSADDSPGNTLVEESCKPTQLEIEGVFDMSVDDYGDEEVSGGVTCVHQAR